MRSGRIGHQDAWTATGDVRGGHLATLRSRGKAEAPTCPVCGDAASALDSVDFNKSCEEARGKRLPPSGIQVQYLRCERCAFCFAPELYRWNLADFEKKIYNDDYAAVDPDYLEVRPRNNANMLLRSFAEASADIRHLDYGGGNGLLSAILLDAGWQSASYDPFVDRDIHLGDFGTFDLITAFEVFEHVPDPSGLVGDLGALLDPEGIVLFSTLVSDGQIVAGQPLTWWYASPRNGHISLYSRQSLALLGASQGLKFASFSEHVHVYWRNVPDWAREFLPKDVG